MRAVVHETDDRHADEDEQRQREGDDDVRGDRDDSGTMPSRFANIT